MRHVPHLHLPAPWADGHLGVTRAQADHLQRVLRVDAGSAVTYTDGAGTLGNGTWDGGSVQRGDEALRPRPIELVMAVAPPASRDRARFVVEKLAELGVERLVWLRTSNGGRRVPSQARLSAWASSGLEQSRGSWLIDVDDTLVGWEDLEAPLVVCEPGAPRLVAASHARTLAIGPEGGFEAGEIPESANRAGLGETILRVETAAVVAAAIVAAANFR